MTVYPAAPYMTDAWLREALAEELAEAKRAESEGHRWRTLDRMIARDMDVWREHYLAAADELMAELEKRAWRPEKHVKHDDGAAGKNGGGNGSPSGGVVQPRTLAPQAGRAVGGAGVPHAGHRRGNDVFARSPWAHR